MMQRPPGATPPRRTPWRPVLASLAAMLVGAATIGVGALSTQIAVEPTATSPAPSEGSTASGSVTPTPRVIAIPQETLSPTPRPTVATTSPPATVIPPAAVTEEPPPISTATPSPVLTVADAPTATPPPTIAPSPPPSPTMAAPSPAVVPTSGPSPAVRLSFGAADWVGGFYRGDGQAYGRPWTALYGADSAYPRAALHFALDAAPVGSSTVIIAGLDDEWAVVNEIMLGINGQAVFAGPSPFANWDGIGDGADAAWTRVAFTIPDGMLRAGKNEIALANLTPASNFNAPPYVLVSEATLELAPGGFAVAEPASQPAQVKKPEKPRVSDNDQGRQKQKQKDKRGEKRGAKKGHDKKGKGRR